MKKVYTLLLIGLLTWGSLWSESLLTLDMKLLQAVTHDQDLNKWSYGGSGTADMALKSTGNKNVKGELSLTYSYNMVSLNKASIKVQFPSLRITMGKTRIGWGEGYIFNSGDVLYGSLSPSVDLTQDEARDETALLTLVRYSLGHSYVEALVMAPTADWTPPAEPVMPGIGATSGGGRLVTELFNTTVEIGYLCKGQEKTAGDRTGHRPYISFHGYGELDWYGSASLAVPFEEADWNNNIRETVNFSFGSFRQFGLGYDGTLSVRLEALVYPWQKWEEDSGTRKNDDESYGLYLYPELILAPGQTVSIPLMAVFSPLDLSAQITTGFSWSVYQGFSFLGYAIGEVGDESDTFTLGNISLMAGMRFKY